MIDQLDQPGRADQHEERITLDTHQPSSWLGALAVTLIGFAAFEFVRRRFALEWGRIQDEIEAAMSFKEPHAAVPEGGEAAVREASMGAP